MRIREIEEHDIADLFAVREATRENALSRQQLASRGITVKTVATMLATTHRGWLCAVDNQVVGFAMGNRQTGEMWVIAVLPEYEGRGIGAQLLTRVEDWLWSEGWTEIWLTTDVDPALRAYGFYQRQGWRDHKIGDNLRYMKKTKPNQGA